MDKEAQRATQDAEREYMIIAKAQSGSKDRDLVYIAMNYPNIFRNLLENEREQRAQDEIDMINEAKKSRCVIYPRQIEKAIS